MIKSFVIAAAAAILGTGGGAALAAPAHTVQGPSSYCVTFGHGPGAAGNVIEYNWDHSPCPPGTYPYSITDTDKFIPSAILATDQNGATQIRVTSAAAGGQPVTYTCTFTAIGIVNANQASFGIECKA